MKRIQRFLSLALFAALLLGILPIMVFAEGNVCKIGNTEYPSLKIALDAAVDGDTIEFLTDIEFNGSFHIKKSVTFDGAGHKFESTGGTWCCPIWLKETTGTYTEENPLTVIFKNMTVTADRIVCDEATFPTRIRFENVTVNALKGEKDSGAIQEAFGIKNNAATTLEIVDSTVLHDGAGRWYPVIEADSTAKKAIVIQNSTLTKRTSGGAIINGGANTEASVDGTSKLINLTESGDKSQNIFRGAMTVDLAKGAEVRNAPTFDCSMDICKDGTIVNDSGAIYVLLSITNQTVELPANGNQLYENRTDKTVCGSSVKLTANKETTFANTGIDLDDGIVTRNAVSIRIADPYGIRFEAAISPELQKFCSEGGDITVRVGMLICPKDYLFGSEKLSMDMTEGYYLKIDCTENLQDNGSFKASLVNISKSHTGVTTQFVARAYAELTIHGNTIVFYAEDSVTASIFQIAQLHKASDGYTENEVIEKIMMLGNKVG